MEIEQIKLNGDERLIDALKSKGYTDIPSNVILDKTLTGIWCYLCRVTFMP